MSTNKGKTRLMDVVLFPHPYQFALVTSEREWEALMKRLQIKGYIPAWLIDGAYGQLHELERGDHKYLVVSLTDKRIPIENVAGILAHEATHCFQKIAAYMSEHTPSKELEAYAIQMITLTLLLEYKKKRKR